DDRRRARRRDRDRVALRLPERLPLPRLRLRLGDRGAGHRARGAARVGAHAPRGRAGGDGEGRGMSDLRAASPRAASGGRPLATMLLALAVGVVLAWSVAPALWQALTALKPDAQITHRPTVYFPHPPTWRHVVALWERKPMAVYLANSAWVSAWATLLC